MKSKQTFFSAAVLKKDIVRFAPLWGLYTVFLLMYILLNWQGDGTAVWGANLGSYTIRSTGILNLFYGGICAITLFGDLFKTRMCNALHAMPIRREGWFLTHTVAGLLFCVVPNTLGALVEALLLQEYAHIAFLWLAVAVLQFIFFFGVGIFSAQCAGNILGAVIVYGIVHFFAVFAAVLFSVFYEPLLYGVSLNMEKLFSYSPAYKLCCYRIAHISYSVMQSEVVFLQFPPQDWLYLAIIAGTGVVMAALGMLLYRRRKLESAGDLMVVKWAKTAFLSVYTLFVGGAIYFLAEQVAQEYAYVFLALGFAIGFFTGRMLLERKVHVFQLKNLLKFCLFVAVFAISIALTCMDPIGITRYVPKPEDVKSIQISPGYWQYLHTGELVQQADFAAFTRIHQQLTQNPEDSTGDMPLHICYQMENGSTVVRQYTLDSEGEIAQSLKGYFSAEEYVFATDDIQALLENLQLVVFWSSQRGIPHMDIGTSAYKTETDVWTRFGSTEGVIDHIEPNSQSVAEVSLVKKLLQALLADCLEGNMAQYAVLHPEQDYYGTVKLMYTEPGKNGNLQPEEKYLEIKIYEDCTNTVQCLENLPKV